MRGLAAILAAWAFFLGTAHAQGFPRLSSPERAEENGGLSADQLDCFRRAQDKPDGWDEARIFVPIGRACEVEDFAVVAAYEGGLRPAYGRRDGCQYFENFSPGRTCAEEFEAHLDRVIANFRKYAAAQREKGAPLRILIYAHGGMVSHQKAVRSAEQQAAWMLMDGYFPLFLIWHSDFPTAYTDYLCCVSDGDPLNIAKVYFGIARAVGDLTAGIGRAPENFGEQQVRSTLTFERNGRSEFFLCPDQRTCPLRREASSTGRNNVIYPNFAAGTDNMNDRLAVPLQRQIAYPLFYPVRGVATVGADAGGRAWDNMVRRTRTAFTGVLPRGVALPADDPSANLRCDGAVSHAPLYGAFGQAFARLDTELWRPEFADARVTFIGHSMGAIVGNEAARLFPCLPLERIVYMAGAAPIRDVQNSVFPVLQRNPEVTFHNLMLHPLAESRELFRRGLAPQGSLLEWVDSMFEGPRSVDDKTVGKWRNVQRGLNFVPEEIVAQTSYRIFPTQAQLPLPECNTALTNTPEALRTAGLKADDPRFQRCHPVVHGGFDDYTFWRDSYLLGEFAAQ